MKHENISVKLPLYNYSTHFWSEKAQASFEIIEYHYSQERKEYIYILTDPSKITFADAVEVKISEQELKRKFERKEIFLL